MENKFIALFSCTSVNTICMTGNLESYRRVSSKLKLETIEDFVPKKETIEDEHTENIDSVSNKSEQSTGDAEAAGQVKTSEQYELEFLVNLDCCFFLFHFLLWTVSCFPQLSGSEI